VDRRFILYRTAVQIRFRSFQSEQIAFNQALSELLSKPDPRKVREYQDLLALLGTFHARSVFHAGTLAVPVDSTRRTSGFADRRLYSYSDGGSSRSLHNGIDLAAPVGTPVFASGARRVMLARERVISGNSVVIEHLPGVFTLYYHLQTGHAHGPDPLPLVQTLTILYIDILASRRGSSRGSGGFRRVSIY
jgi:murein DD-endopeptidase MepM/ murein hydrolase activator NlpD